MSGSAALVHQIAWQRGLIRYLGGCEAIASVIVTAAFMAGLGVGSWTFGKGSRQVNRPLQLFFGLELALGFMGALLYYFFTPAGSTKMITLQHQWILAGWSQEQVFTVVAILFLALPCLIMGGTLPLAAEGAKRQLRVDSPSFLGLMLFVNTLGSYCGCLIASVYFIPWLGISRTIGVGCGLNLLAGLVGLMSYRKCPSHQEETGEPIFSGKISESSPDEITPPLSPALFPYPKLTLFITGFVSLGYEIYLTRLLALKFDPLPFTFAAVLSGFLLWWSLGSLLAAKIGEFPPEETLFALIFSLLVVDASLFFDFDFDLSPFWALFFFPLKFFFYFIPPLLFGYLFSQVLTHSARYWGEDTGGLYGCNLAGSLAGIYWMAYHGFYLHTLLLPLFLAAPLFLLSSFQVLHSNGKGWKNILFFQGAIFLLLGYGISQLDLRTLIPQSHQYFSREGVIEILNSDHVYLNGLWHSRLIKNNNHLGTNNWFMGVIPAMALAPGASPTICVVGAGVGISPKILSNLTGATVDAYEINRGLKDVYDDFPGGTGRCAHIPNVSLVWRDARLGLATTEKSYDLILTNPLHLNQSGSGLLNSLEFFELVKRRLKPTGIFALYSNGTPEQAFAVRQTASRVFPNATSFFNGYLLLLAHQPIHWNKETIKACWATNPLLFEREIRPYAMGGDSDYWVALEDNPRLDWGDGGVLISDDYPVVEYPDELARLTAKIYPGIKLPQPRLSDKKK